MKFRKKPMVVEAEQFTHGGPPAALPRGVYFRTDERGVPTFYVITVHGQEAVVVARDWIITENDGLHHYPCKPDIFEATYEPVAS